MRIHMNTLAAGPAGIYEGDCECPDEEARRYIAGGFAIPLGGIIETAMLAPAQPITAPVETRVSVEVLDPVLTFGKYKGKTVSEIYAKDPDYVKDFLAKNDTPEIAAAAKAISA